MNNQQSILEADGNAYNIITIYLVKNSMFRLSFMHWRSR